MQNIPPREILEYIADLFKGFADPTRVHILSLLLAHGELCVTDIAEKVALSQSAISTASCIVVPGWLDIR